MAAPLLLWPMLAAATAIVPTTRTLTLEPCTVPGQAAVVRCGILSVPENRSQPGGTRIGLKVVVLPALEPDDSHAPLYDLAGGPGLAATGGADFYLTVGQVHRQHRDIVLVDQRGTGGSAPLECPELAGTGSAYPEVGVRACRKHLALSADLAQYTTADSVADLQAVRTALGQGPVDLFAISYGTRLALAWIAAEPKAIRSAILIGTVPDDARLPLWHARNAQDTLDQVFADCRADAACAAAHPTLAASWKALLARPDFDSPARESLRAQMVTTTGERALPALITHMATTGPEPAKETTGGPSLAEGLYLSVTCAEDVPWIGDADAAAATRGTFLGDWRIARQQAACTIWNVPKRKLAYARAPSNVPVLFIAGTRDYVTPVAWVERVARQFPHGRVVQIPFLGHFPDGLSGMECIDTMMSALSANPDVAAVPAGCVATMHPPKFATAVQAP